MEKKYGNSCQNIKNAILKGANKEYSHIIIFYILEDNAYSYSYVKNNDNIYDVLIDIKYMGAPDMYQIEEIYNYEMSLQDQMREKCAYNINTVKTDKESDFLKLAHEFAKEKHKGQMRKGNNSKEYITHPENVVNLIEYYKKNDINLEIVKAASYLHDCLEDTDTTFDEIATKFGMYVAYLVLELTTNKEMKDKLGKPDYLSLKMKSMTNDALDIKLCDRLDNISGLYDVSDAFRSKYINETIYIINFLLDNKTLTDTQKIIINDIIKTVKNLINVFNKTGIDDKCLSLLKI